MAGTSHPEFANLRAPHGQMAHFEREGVTQNFHFLYRNNVTRWARLGPTKSSKHSLASLSITDWATDQIHLSLSPFRRKANRAAPIDAAIISHQALS